MYDDYLYHGWATSKDPSKYAQQKRREQEYNRQYYKLNKDKWLRELSRKHASDFYKKKFSDGNKPIGQRSGDKGFAQYTAGQKIINAKARALYGQSRGFIQGPEQSALQKKVSNAKGTVSNVEGKVRRTVNAVQDTVEDVKRKAQKVVDTGKKVVEDIKDDIKFIGEVYTSARKIIDKGKASIREMMKGDDPMFRNPFR